MRNFKAIKKIFFISVVLIFGFFLYSNSALAQATYDSLVTIPGIGPNPGVLWYLGGLYAFLISVVGVVAMGAIVIGGARYLTSVGNPSAIEDAKHTIWSAIYGLILALVSWVLIGTINPDILVLKNPDMPWEATGYYPTASDSLEMCDGPGSLGDGTADAPCHCIDNMEVDVFFTQPVLTGPYVVSTSIAPCTTNVPVTINSITFTFNEPLDPSTIDTTNVNSNLRSVIGSYSEVIPPTQVVATLNGKDLTVTWPGATLNPASQQVVIIRGLIAQDGSTNSAWVKNLSGVGMATDYWVWITPQSAFPTVCSRPLPPIIDCETACSNPATPGLTPPGYHCIKADLRVGNGYNPIEKSVTVKSGEAVYFDARTYSADPTSPGFNTDVSSDSPLFDNGMNVYEICYDASSITCSLATASYGCADNPINLCAIAWVITGKTDDWMPCGVTRTSYTVTTEAKTFRAKLRVIRKSDCLTRYEDEVMITVNPK